MTTDHARILLPDTSGDFTESRDLSQPSWSPAGNRRQPLDGRVVLSVGDGGPEHTAVNQALQTAGAVVLVKSSVSEVTRMLRAFVPSVVVADLASVDHAGLAVLRAIRKLPPAHGGALPVVGICRHIADAGPTIRAGFQGVLVPPFAPTDVVPVILGAIQRPL